MQEQILQAFQRNANDEAVALATRWVAEAPGQAEPLSWLATAQRQAGDIDAALASLDQALALAPDDAGLHLQRATLLLTGRRFDDADQALARTTELNPNQFEGYLLQAHLAIARRDYDKARSLGRTAARLVPDHPQVLAIEGMVELQEGNHEPALALLNQAARAQPDDPRILYALGFAFIANGHLAFAEQALRRVIELQPGAGAAMVPLMATVAELAVRQGNAEGAAAMIERMLAVPGIRTAPVHRIAAGLRLQAGEPRQAADHALAGLADQPGDRRLLEAALMAWERLGAEEEARGTLDGLLAANDQLPDLWLARLAVEPVGSPAAAAVAQAWVEAMPGCIPALEARMRVHDMAGEKDQAIALARRIIELEPGRISGEQRVVSGYLEDGRGEEAIAHVQAMVGRAEREGARAYLRTWLGVVMDAAGREAEAVATWLSLRQDECAQRLPLPPQAKSPASWPELAAIPEDCKDRPLFLWGPPGSQVERVASVLGAASPVMRGDRFSPAPPDDPFQRFDTLAALANDQLGAAELVAQWREKLPARGIADGNVIDWLLWWDNALLWSLRPHLPQGRLLVVLRDPRDMLLDWVAFGGSLPLGLAGIPEASGWLQRSLEQVANLHDRNLYPSVLLRIDGVEDDPQGLSALLERAFGARFPVVNPMPPRLPAGHWRKYRDVLGAAFNNLTPVAVRLGYPEN